MTELPHEFRCGTCGTLAFTSDDLAAHVERVVAVRLAAAWDEGHNATDEHGTGNCECLNPFRAALAAPSSGVSP